MMLRNAALGAAISTFALGCADSGSLDVSQGLGAVVHDGNPCGSLEDYVGSAASYSTRGGLVVVTDTKIYPSDSEYYAAGSDEATLDAELIDPEEPFVVAWTIYNGSSSAIGAPGANYYADEFRPVRVAVPSLSERRMLQASTPRLVVPIAWPSGGGPLQSDAEGTPSLSANSYVAACPAGTTSCTLDEAQDAASVALEPGSYGLMVAEFVATDAAIGSSMFFTWGAALVDADCDDATCLLQASNRTPALRDLVCLNGHGEYQQQPGGPLFDGGYDSWAHQGDLDYLNQTKGVAVVRLTAAPFSYTTD